MNAMMGVMSGLHSGPVFRLKETFAGIGKSHEKIFQHLTSLSDSGKSSTNMRAYLKTVNPPCLPFLGMFLKDLTFIDEGNPNTIPNASGTLDLINFNKRRQISDTIRKVRSYQNQSFTLEFVQSIQDKINREAEVLDESELWECSEYIQPRPGKPRGPLPGPLGGRKKRKDEELSFELEKVENYPYYPPDSPDNIILNSDTGAIMAGTLPKIVERLTHHSHPGSSFLHPSPFFLSFNIKTRTL